MFEKVSRSLKYDSIIFLVHKHNHTHIYIYVWTPTPITLPCLLARTGKYEESCKIAPSIKSSVLRYFYRELTGDITSESENSLQVIMEDLDIICDLRTFNSSHDRSKYEQECDKV